MAGKQRPVDSLIARIHEGHCPDCAHKLTNPDRAGWLCCPAPPEGCGQRWKITTIRNELFPVAITYELARGMAPPEPIGAAAATGIL